MITSSLVSPATSYKAHSGTVGGFQSFRSSNTEQTSTNQRAINPKFGFEPITTTVLGGLGCLGGILGGVFAAVKGCFCFCGCALPVLLATGALALAALGKGKGKLPTPPAAVLD
jgi:hypothetical protein